MNKINAIVVEGIEQSGKSSQLMLLRMFLMEKKDVQVIELSKKYSQEQMISKINELRVLFDNNPNTLFLIKHSLIASPLQHAMDIEDYPKAIESYRTPIGYMNELCKDFNLLHLLLRPIDNGDFKRLNKIQLKQSELTYYYDALDLFEKSQYYRAIKWHICDFDKEESMLEILEKIKKILKPHSIF